MINDCKYAKKYSDENYKFVKMPEFIFKVVSYNPEKETS